MPDREEMHKSVFEAVLSNSDFSDLSSFIYSHCGIKLPMCKKHMLEGRLRKRLHASQNGAGVTRESIHREMRYSGFAVPAAGAAFEVRLRSV